MEEAAWKNDSPASATGSGECRRTRQLHRGGFLTPPVPFSLSQELRIKQQHAEDVQFVRTAPPHPNWGPKHRSPDGRANTICSQTDYTNTSIPILGLETVASKEMLVYPVLGFQTYLGKHAKYTDCHSFPARTPPHLF